MEARGVNVDLMASWLISLSDAKMENGEGGGDSRCHDWWERKRG